MARRTKAEAEATRESILDSAESVFMSKGVARASLEEIARTSGVTRGAVYWHFKNKQDILDAMLERVRAPLGAVVDDTDTSGDSLSNLRQLCITSLRKLATDEQYFRVHYILFHRNETDQTLSKHRELATETIEFVSSLLATPQNRQRLRPGLTPELTARILHSQMLGLFFDYLVRPEQEDLAQQAPIIVDTLLRGLITDEH